MMFEIIFAILTMIYILIAIKIDQWITISALGFKSETPTAFLRSPGIYNIVRSVFFLADASSALLLNIFPWYIGLLVLLIIWLGASWLGRRLAFERYRCIMSEMVNCAETEDEKLEYLKEARRSNQELQEEACHNIKIEYMMGKSHTMFSHIKSTFKENVKRASQKTVSPCAFFLFTIAILIFVIVGTKIGVKSYNTTGNIESTLGALFGGVIIWPILAYLLVFLEVSIRKKLRPKRDLIFARVLFIFSILLLANFLLQNYKPQIMEIYSGIAKHKRAGSDQPSKLAQLTSDSNNKSLYKISGQQQEAAEELYAEGLEFISDGDYKNALDCLGKAAEIFPQNENIWANIGLCYYNLCQNQEAIEAYKKAIRIKPDFVEAYFWLGVSYKDIGKHHEALETYHQSTRIKPDNADAYHCQGMSYAMLGQNQKSIDAFKEAIRINPENASTHYCLAINYLIQENKMSAIEEYNILKKLDVELANKLLNVIHQNR